MKKKDIESSTAYWISRYSSAKERNYKGASGNGRIPFRLRYKAQAINSLFGFYHIKSILDLGCGDGSLIGLLKIDNYFGIEIEANLVQALKLSFSERENFHFSVSRDKSWPGEYDCLLSIDVIFHLLEDHVYRKYMDELFSGISSFVLVKSSDRDETGLGRNSHIRHRNFSKDVEEFYPRYVLIYKSRPRRKRLYLSISDRDSFYLFKRI